MKRILVLHTGGTLGMVPLEAHKHLKPDALAGEVFRFIPEARQLAELDIRLVYNIDSSNVQIEHWQLLAKVIEEEIDHYDGFVIIHGTDTMVYTASALSFALMNLPKPVILTGAQRPIAEIRTDAKSNLVNSVEMATYDIPEVGLFFNNQLFRGNRAKKVSIDHFDAFASPNYPHLADVGLNIDIHQEYIRRPNGLFRIQTEFSDRVLAIHLYPGMTPEHLNPLLDSDIEAFLIEAYGAGNVPIQEKSLIPFIEKATEKGKLVAITSQSFEGSVDLELYECGTLAAQAGAISCGDMTTEAAAVKLMFLLGQFKNPEKVRHYLPIPLAGELSTRFSRRAADRRS